MPTCSQAKIITNLETDIQKRLFALTNINENANSNINGSDHSEPDENYEYHNLQSHNLDLEITKLRLNQNEGHKSYSSYNRLNKVDNQRKYSQPNFTFNHNSMSNLNIRKNKTYIELNSTKLNKLQLNQQLNTQLQQQQQQNSTTQITQLPQMSFRNSNSNINSNRIRARRISIEELPTANFESHVPHKIPIVFGEYSTKKESVPVNFLYNSSYRNTKNSVTTNQIKISSLRNSLNLKNNGSDGEDEEEMISGSSDTSTSDKSSSASSPDNLPKSSNKNSLFNQHRKSTDFTSILPLSKSKRNSLEDNQKLKDFNTLHYEKEMTKRFNTTTSHHTNNSNGYYTTFPKLALEVEQIGNSAAHNIDTNNELKDTLEDNLELQKRISINQAKRLLALASIRPSKTFHKSMTQEEIEVLKKYYDLMKPKVGLNSNSNDNQLELEKKKYENLTPMVYDTGKVSLMSLHNVKQFIEFYKKDIDSGIYVIDYDTVNDPKGFVLKNQANESVIKFPNEINDTFFALAVSASERENQGLGEANLFRIVNWNDTTVNTNSKTQKTLDKATLKSMLNLNNPTSTNGTSSPTSSTQEKSGSSSASTKSSSSSSIPNSSSNSKEDKSKTSSVFTYSSSSASPTSSTLSFEYIKNLSSLVNSIIEPKLLKQLSYSGVDVSVLPGGINYELPSFEELGIDLNHILASSANNAANPYSANNYNSSSSNNNNLSEHLTMNIQYQNPKLKNAAYKKLKDKVNTSKVMFFSSPPERKPLSVIFEYAGVDIGHESILEETNKYLEQTGGHVESLEFVPRSVHFGSVYVENLWILTLNDMNTKFYTITNGIKIKDEKISVKSYDEFIFSEYERFIRNEKYKKLIKNHEKAIEKAKNSQIGKRSKKSVTHS